MAHLRVAREAPPTSRFFRSHAILGKNYAEQECIPVGCTAPILGLPLEISTYPSRSRPSLEAHYLRDRTPVPRERTLDQTGSGITSPERTWDQRGSDIIPPSVKRQTGVKNFTFLQLVGRRNNRLARAFLRLPSPFDKS